MNKEIPLTWLAIIFLLIAMLMSYYDLDGFVHSAFGLVVGYFFHKATVVDRIKNFK
jgi:hypothetical protein